MKGRSAEGIYMSLRYIRISMVQNQKLASQPIFVGLIDAKSQGKNRYRFSPDLLRYREFQTRFSIVPPFFRLEE